MCFQDAGTYRVGQLQAGVDQRHEVVVVTGLQADDVINDAIHLRVNEETKAITNRYLRMRKKTKTTAA